jgi:peptidoglycan-associated lipoprotein
MRLNTIVTICAAVFLLSACAEEQKAGGGAGSGSSSTMGSSIKAGSQEDLKANYGDRIFFDFDKSDLRPDARAQAQKWAEFLKKYPQDTVTIEGNCDDRGTREYNLALGERRASAAKRFLVTLGIDAKRVATISYGKERPAVVGDNEAAWAQNRRDVMVVN